MPDFDISTNGLAISIDTPSNNDGIFLSTREARDFALRLLFAHEKAQKSRPPEVAISNRGSNVFVKIETHGGDIFTCREVIDMAMCLLRAADSADDYFAKAAADGLDR